MGRHIIDKVVGEFDYGHNVWTQELDSSLSCGSQCKCKWRHGHRGKVVVYLEAEELQDSSGNMVIDFNDLKIMTRFIDGTLDHKYLIDIKDPANFDTFAPFWDNVDNTFKDDVLEYHKEGYYTIKPKFYRDMKEVLITKYESYVILPFVPTSENLSKWMFDIMSMYLTNKNYVDVHKVEWYETPKSKATYYGK